MKKINREALEKAARYYCEATRQFPDQEVLDNEDGVYFTRPKWEMVAKKIEEAQIMKMALVEYELRDRGFS